MASFCLLKDQVIKLRKALASKEIDAEYLSKLSSENRRKFLAKYVGEENAKQTNALFESKLLLKNQKAGLFAWAKKIGGVTPEVRRDMLAKIERLDSALSQKDETAFLKDLVNTRLGLSFTQEEANKISELSQKVTELKKNASKEGTFKTEKQRLDFGMAKVQIEKYVNDLKLQAKAPTDIKGKVIEGVKEAPGILKSLQASLDNSFFGRQGIKVLYTNPKIWTRNFLKSWTDIGKEFKGMEAIDAVKADIYSRPNTINGKYDAGGYGLGVLSEEAYPSSLPSKIPLLGRLFKASESAYNGAALRMRADLADKFIKLAEQNGVNMLNKENAKPVGDMIGLLTGRGSLGKAETLAKETNVLLYSVKFLKSNIDTLLAPAKYAGTKIAEKTGISKGYDTKGAEFAGKESAKATLRIVGTVAAILATAKFIDPESVDEDPTSTNFGKIKIWGHWVDITGGMGSIVRLAMRGITGKSKSSTGKITNLREVGFGKKTFLDELEDFAEGKLSPFAGVLRDSFKGELFGGEKFTWKGAIKNVIQPLPIQNATKILQDPKSEFALGSIILDGLGLSTTQTPKYKTDWEKSTSRELQQFKEQIGAEDFKKANDDYNRVYEWWYEDVKKKESFKKLSEEEKQVLITKNKDIAKYLIFESRDFKYEKQEVDQEVKDIISELSMEK